MGLHLNPIEGSHYEPEDDNHDHLLEAGWWGDQQVETVTKAIKALVAAPIYEGGDKANGISVEFLMRLSLLQYEAELDVPHQMVAEATAYFAAKEARA
jgi:hypothetical protein